MYYTLINYLDVLGNKNDGYEINDQGIEFDDYTQNDDGAYWAEMCCKCAEKYHDLISNDIDDGTAAIGCCSVKGCSNNGMDYVFHFYIDFDNEFIEWSVANEDHQ